MPDQILLTSPEREFTALIEKVKKDFDFNIVVRESTFEDAVNVARNYINLLSIQEQSF